MKITYINNKKGRKLDVHALSGDKCRMFTKVDLVSLFRHFKIYQQQKYEYRSNNRSILIAMTAIYGHRMTKMIGMG